MCRLYKSYMPMFQVHQYQSLTCFQVYHHYFCLSATDVLLFHNTHSDDPAQNYGCRFHIHLPHLCNRPRPSILPHTHLPQIPLLLLLEFPIFSSYYLPSSKSFTFLLVYLHLAICYYHNQQSNFCQCLTMLEFPQNYPLR